MSIEKIKGILSGIKPPVNRADCDGIVCIDNWASGNMDDAYELGVTDGEAKLAEKLRLSLK